jgi:hypothetical protein
MKGVYRTKSEARKSAKRAVRSIRIKVVNLVEQRKSEKAFATMKMVR